MIAPLALAFLALGVVAMASRRSNPPPPSSPSSGKSLATTPAKRAVIAIINAAAAKHGVPARIALAWAQVESGLNPAAEGDRQWHTYDGGKRYERLVRDAPKFARNPFRHEPSRWHSYGLFQLLAPYHTGPTEDPKLLLDPRVNADRGVRRIAELLQQTGGDWQRARLLYTGAAKSSDAKQAAVVAAISRAVASTTDDDTRIA